jgi:hypothetical protein
VTGYSEDLVYQPRPPAKRLSDVELSGVTYTRDRVQAMLREGRTVQRVADLSTWPRAHVVRAGFEIGLRFDATSDVMTASGAGVQPAPAPADLPPAPPARSPLAELCAAITELREQLGALESALAEVRAELEQRIHAREAAHQPPPAPPASVRPTPAHDSGANLDAAARAARVERLRVRRDAYVARVDALGGPRVVVAWATAHGYADVRPQRIPDAVLDAMTAAAQVAS